MTLPLIAALGKTAAQEIAFRMGLDPVLPDTQKAFQAEGLGLLARVGMDVGGSHILEDPHFDHLTFIQKTTLSLALNACLRGGNYLEGRAEILLRRSGLVSKPDRRDSLTPAGEALQWAQHEAIQFTAILGALHLCSALDIHPSDSLFSTALSIAVSEDMGTKIANEFRPYPTLEQRRVKQREIAVYTGYTPLAPDFSAPGISQWEDFILALPLFTHDALPLRVHAEKKSLQIVRSSPQDPLRGVVLFVVDTQVHLKELIRDKQRFLHSYFTVTELASGFGDRIRKLDNNPVEQAGKVADIIEIKKAIWSFLTGSAPRTLSDWVPHEIELSRDPHTHLAAVSLAPRLQRMKDRLNLGDIRMTWTDHGHIATGIISFRDRAAAPNVLGTGIDIVDTRYYWRHEEGHWVWANAKRFFSAEIYQQRYGNTGKKPTAVELAAQHAVSEAVFKALYPYHPSAEHSTAMYRQFGMIPEIGKVGTLDLSGENQWALEQWNASHTQAYLYKIGEALIAVATLHND